MKRKDLFRLLALLFAVFLASAVWGLVARAQSELEGIDALGIGEDLGTIEDYLGQSLGGEGGDFSFLTLMKALMEGELSRAALEAGKHAF